MANQAQRDYWNAAAGRNWVALQSAFDRTFEGLNALLLDRSAVRAGESVLDVGCGSGATVLAAARCAGAGGRVLAVDISEPLLALARERVRLAGLANVEFLLADAQSEALPASSFDLICSRLGVMFFEDPVEAFRNLRAALRPGGRLCFACWAPLDDNPWLKLPLAVGVQRLGPPKQQPRRAPGPMAFSDAEYVRDILADAGFSAIGIEELRPEVGAHATAEEEAPFALAAGPLARLVNEKNPDPAVRADLVREVAEALRPYVTEAGVRAPAAFYCVTARNL